VETVARVDIRGVRALPDARYELSVGAPGHRGFEFEFSRELADHGGYEIIAPQQLRFPPGSISSMGTYLYRIIGLFHRVVASASVPVTAMSAAGPSTVVLEYQGDCGAIAQLGFQLPSGPLTPAVVSLSPHEEEAVARLGLDAETVGRALYAFGMQMRQEIDILVPEPSGDAPPPPESADG